MIVHKFGGTSVGDAERFSGVADILIEKHGLENGAAPCDAVVVLSAMSGATNQLIAGARAAAEGRDVGYRDIKAGLLSRHLGVPTTSTLHTKSTKRSPVLPETSSLLPRICAVLHALKSCNEPAL